VDPAWIAVTGTLAGTALGGGLGWLAERGRWKRQEMSRWQADRRSVYASFLRASEDYEAVIHELQDEFAGQDPWSVPRDRLDSAFNDLRRSMGEVQLMASSDLAQAAQSLIFALVPAFAELPSDHEYGPYGWAAVTFDPPDPADDVVDRRGIFVGKARRELNVSGRGGWLPMNLPIDLGHRRAEPPAQSET
jgi:hypothetical protein